MRAWLGGLVAWGAVLGGCAAAPAVGRGGPVYEVIVDTVNGRQTAMRGPVGYPACTVQVGREVRQVWLASERREAGSSPPVLRADATALKAGVLLESGWNAAVVHHVTDDELAAGAAVVYLPRLPQPVVIELRFRPVGALALTR